MAALVVLGYALVVFFEITPMIKKKETGKLLLYSALILISFVLSMLLSLGVKLPNIAEPVEKALRVILGMEES